MLLSDTVGFISDLPHQVYTYIRWTVFSSVDTLLHYPTCVLSILHDVILFFVSNSISLSS